MTPGRFLTDWALGEKVGPLGLDGRTKYAVRGAVLVSSRSRSAEGPLVNLDIIRPKRPGFVLEMLCVAGTMGCGSSGGPSAKKLINSCVVADIFEVTETTGPAALLGAL